MAAEPVAAEPVAAEPRAALPVVLPREDLAAQITQLFAEQTGYEVDELDPTYLLEADLGIDTVKQAEIFGILRETYHGASSDADQNPRIGWWRFDSTLADDEDVVAGTLSHLALVVEHQRFDRPCVGSFDFGQDVVQIVE